ncbi:MAG: DUF924 family protein [Pseudomonadota bacterium]
MRAVAELARALHVFWFGQLEADGTAPPERARRWFQPDPTFDQDCDRFGDDLAALPGSIDRAWFASPEHLLAGILLRDQIPRNLYREDPQAFGWDAEARQLCFFAIDQGADRALGLDERAFCYMPLMHSERLRDQYLAVGLFTTLRDTAAAPLRQQAGNYLRHAQQHRDTILEFGRFPYRNLALGRTSTDAEQAWLNQRAG